LSPFPLETDRPTVAPAHACVGIAETGKGVRIAATCPIEAFKAIVQINAIHPSGDRTRLAVKKRQATSDTQHYDAYIPDEVLSPGLKFEAVDSLNGAQRIWIPGADDIDLPPLWEFSRYRLLLQYDPEPRVDERFRPFVRDISKGDQALNVRITVFAVDSGFLKDAKLVVLRFRADQELKEFPLQLEAGTQAFGIDSSLHRKYTGRDVFHLSASVPLPVAFERNALHSAMVICGNEIRHIHPYDPIFSKDGAILEWQDSQGLTLLHHFSDPALKDLRLEVFRFTPRETERAKALLNAPPWDGEDAVWLIGEYPNTARDNGWALFQHLQGADSNIDARYVISWPNIDGVQPTDANILIYGSLQHLEACLRTQAILFSHHAVYLFPHMMSVLMKKNGDAPVTHFLQHGVLAIKPMLSAYEKRKHNYDVFNVSSIRERDLVVEVCKWSRKDVVVSGLPRWDALRRRNDEFLASGGVPKRILIFPTWRTFLDKLPDEFFLQSSFFENWKQAIGRIVAVAETKGLAVDFCPHSLFERFNDAFSDLGVNIVGMRDAIERLPEYAMLITDYSSLCFEFLYLDKPSAFFMFDRDEFFAKSEPYIDIEQELPGTIVLKADEFDVVIPEILEGRRGHNADRANFVKLDSGNCARVVEETHRRIARKAVLAVERAAKAKDYLAVRRYGRPFEVKPPAADALSSDVVRIAAASIEAALMLGLMSEATSALRQAERSYGTSSELSFVAAKIHRAHGDLDSALTALDIAFCAAPARRNLKANDLIVRKAEILLDLGRAGQARKLLADNLPNVHTEATFDLLGRSVTEAEQIVDFEDIVLPRLPNFGADFQHALYHYALLLLRFGKTEKAIAVARERFMAVCEYYAFGAQSKQLIGSDIQGTEAALSDLLHELSAFRNNFFLVGRTLLKHARGETIEGKIDIGVGENAPAQAIRDALGLSMRFAVLPAGIENLISLRHINGQRIDIFRHYLRDGRLHREDGSARWSNAPFEITTTKLLNQECAVSTDVNRYLSEAYGDWQMPNEEFDDFFGARNVAATRAQDLVVQGLLRLTDFYLSGKKLPLRHVRDRLRRLYPTDPLLFATLQNILKNTGLYRGMPPAKSAASGGPKTTKRLQKAVFAKPTIQRKRSVVGGPVDAEALRRENAAMLASAGEPLPGLAPLSASERDAAPSALAKLFRRVFSLANSSGAADIEVRRLKAMLDADPGNAHLRKQFERVAIQVGREKLKAEKYDEACQVFHSLRAVAESTDQADRNLSMASLKGARQAEGAGDKQKALTFWRYLHEAQPGSKAAVHGITRCSTSEA
jgi:CDP-glycerol glycerophosphotransferase (TagB/SpsB family)